MSANNIGRYNLGYGGTELKSRREAGKAAGARSRGGGPSAGRDLGLKPGTAKCATQSCKAKADALGAMYCAPCGRAAVGK